MSIKKYVFISYKSEEVDEARAMKRKLEENGIECWMAPESIPCGSEYDEKLSEAVDECTTFVLMLSSLAQSSNWIKNELSIARNSKKLVLPFVLEACELKGAFKTHLISSQIFDASSFSSKEDAYTEFVNIVKGVFAGAQSEDTGEKTDKTVDKQHSKHLAELITLYNQGINNVSTNPAEAEAAFLKAIECARKYPDTVSSAIGCYMKLAYMYKARKNYEDALKHYDLCMEKCRELRRHDPEYYDSVIAEIHYHKGCIFAEENKINKAIVEYNRSIELYNTFANITKYSSKLAEVHKGLATLLGQYNIVQDAVEQHNLCIKLFERLVNMKSASYGLDLGLAHSNLGQLYLKWENIPLALQSIKKARDILLKLLEDTGDEGYRPYVDALNAQIEQNSQ